MTDKNKPEQFSISLYENPKQNIEKITFTQDGKDGPTIVIHKYCMDVNYGLSQEIRDKIVAAAKKMLEEI